MTFLFSFGSFSILVGCRDVKQEIEDSAVEMTDTATVAEPSSSEPSEPSQPESVLDTSCVPVLEAAQSSWSVPISGAVRLQGLGGSGDYRWTVSEDTPYGFVDAQSGLFTATSSSPQTVIITLSDTNCSDLVSLEVEITDRFTVSPSYAKVPFGATITPSFTSGADIVECSFMANSSQASLSADCSYTAGNQSGKDIITFHNPQTNEFQNVTFDVQENIDLDVWGKEIILPLDSQFTLTTLGGSGTLVFGTPSSEAVIVEDGRILAQQRGTATISVQDAYISSLQEEITVHVTEPVAYEAEPWSTGTQYPHGKTYDVNGDGYEDIIIANPQGGHGAEPYSGNILVFLGSANGIESQAAVEVGGLNQSELFGSTFDVADLNGDGIGDLVAGINSLTSSGVRIFYGQPDTGLFETSPSMILHGSTIELCDFGNDGDIDIITATAGLSSTIYRPVSGLFTPLNKEVIAGRGRCGDFNGDGVVDLLVNRRRQISGYEYAEIWFLGVQGGAFVETSIGIDYGYINPSGTTGSHIIGSVKDVDINGDGIPSYGIYAKKTLLDHWGITANLENLGYTVETGAFLFYDDFETDTSLESWRSYADYDLVVLTETASIRQYENNVILNRNSENEVIANIDLWPSLADSNGVLLDSDLDVVWSGVTSSGSILFGSADLDMDGVIDFVTQGANARGVRLYQHETSGGVTTELSYDSMAAAGEHQGSGVAIVQFEGETEPRLVIGRPSFEHLSPRYISAAGDGAGGWDTPEIDENMGNGISLWSSSLGSNIMVTDYNSDGYDDLLVSDANNISNTYLPCATNSYAGYHVFPGSENGISYTKSIPFGYYKYYAIQMLPLQDFNGDGYSDFLVPNSSYGNYLFWGVDQDVDPLECPLHIIPQNTYTYKATSLGDLDGDGCADYAQRFSFANPGPTWWNTSAIYIFYGYGGAGCRTQPEFTAIRHGISGDSRFAEIASAPDFDLDGDGITDIVVSSETEYTLSSKGGIGFLAGSYIASLSTEVWDGVNIPPPEDINFHYLPYNTLMEKKSPDNDSGFGSYIKAMKSADGSQNWIAVGRPTAHHAGRNTGSWEFFSLENGAWKTTPDIVISGRTDDAFSSMGTVLNQHNINGETWFSVGMPKSDLVGVDTGAAMGFRIPSVP